MRSLEFSNYVLNSFWPFDTLLVYLGSTREIWKCIQFLLKYLNLNSQGNAKQTNLNIFIFPRIKSLNNNNRKQSSFNTDVVHCTVMAFNLLGIFSSQKSKLSKKKMEGVKYRHCLESDFKNTFGLCYNKALNSSKVIILFSV